MRMLTSYLTLCFSIDTSLYPSTSTLVFRSLWRFLPEAVLDQYRYLPGKEYARLRHYLDFVLGIARDVMVKGGATADGKDVLSVFLRANRSENPKTMLTEGEVVDQVCASLPWFPALSLTPCSRGNDAFACRT